MKLYFLTSSNFFWEKLYLEMSNGSYMFKMMLNESSPVSAVTRLVYQAW